MGGGLTAFDDADECDDGVGDDEGEGSCIGPKNACCMGGAFPAVVMEGLL